jgi:hypothetical protein
LSATAVKSTFPFIVGVGRSGTTLVRAILDSHPEVAIPGESHFIPRMAARERAYQAREGFLVESFLADVLRDPRFRRWGLPGDQVRECLRLTPPDDLPAAIRRLYELYAEHRGKGRYGDKTPAYVHHVATLDRLFPEARFVHVIRDGRDVALSVLDHPSMSGPLPKLAVAWRRGVEKGRRAGRRLGHDRYLEIRYERLVEQPEQVARSLCEFIGLGFHPQMLRYHERANEIIEPTRHPEAHGRIHLPPTKGLRDWRTQMSREDVGVFAVLAGDLLTALGYEPGDRPRIWSRVAVRRNQLRMEAGRIVRAARKSLKRSVAGGPAQPSGS